MDPPLGSSDVLSGSGGARRSWYDTPIRVREAVEAHVGSSVVETVSQLGGFSPGVAARLLLADGSRIFVKATSAECNPDSPDIHRSEAAITAALPPRVPAPRLVTTCEIDGWVTLVFEDVHGHPPTLPWRQRELGRVLDALAALPAILTPSPVSAPTIQSAFERQFAGWRTLAGEGGPVPDVDPWVVANLERLASIEGQWANAAIGDTLLHTDIRADNILLTEERVVFVDWPWACVGAPWIDLMFLLPSVAMQGGPEPHDVFDAHPLAREADPEAVTSVITAFAGFMIHGSTRPAPPGIPRLRSFQRAQGDAAIRWLMRRVL